MLTQNKFQLRRSAIMFVFVALMITTFVTAEPTDNAHGWRLEGIHAYPDANPPMEWSGTENVLWKTEMPNRGNASPTIYNDRIFITAEPFKLLCLDKDSGEILWQKDNARDETMTPEQIAKRDEDVRKRRPIEGELRKLQKQHREARQNQRKDPENAELRQKVNTLRQQINEKQKELAPYKKYERPGTHGANGYASPTAVTDGERVYALFGNGVASCYDMDGNRVWIKYIDSPRHGGWGHSSSPVLVDGKLLVHLRKMHALDPETGEEIWVSNADEKWGTAFPIQIDNTWIVVTGQGDFVRVSDGKVLADKKFGMGYGSPYVKDGVVYAVDQKTGVALKLPSEVSDPLQLEVLWKNRGHNDRVYASTIEVDGILYAMGGHGSKLLIAMDATNGETIYEQKMDFNHRQAYSSIVLAGDYLLISSESGQCAIVKPGRSFELVRMNDLGDGYRTTPVIDHDRIFIRAFKHMYCISK